MTEQTTPPVEEQSRVERAAGATAPSRRLRFGLLGEVRNLGLVGVMIVLVVIGWASKPDTFPTGSNFVSILTLASAVGVIAVGMTFVIIGGGIDLSVGSLMALASVCVQVNVADLLVDQVFWEWVAEAMRGALGPVASIR